MIDYFQTSSGQLVTATLEHIILSGLSLLIALVLASAITILLIFLPRLRQFSVYAVSLLYAIPSFALFALLIPWTGLGKGTAITALVIYAQYTLVRTFLAGLTQIDPSILEAAIGMGMTKWQVFTKIQLPLAVPSIIAGIRLAATSIIAIATIAATVNAGGLGTILFEGLRSMSLPKLVWGILLTVTLSLIVNLILYLIEEIINEKDSAA
ncbi:ABC transporter permease [Streptococcus dentapri]|uniref:ABC transporter permease n=1 Tax=Streptococcus dentapri TaxID=573564 RepID=A0ABV8D297_9STRE